MFPKGLGGVAVVVLAAVAVIAAGFLLSGDAEQETRTVWNDVADITGLFSASSEPEYLEFSPSENFTGWRESGRYYMSGVDYTEPSQGATDYIVPQQDRTSAISTAVTGNYLVGSVTVYMGEWDSQTTITGPELVGLDEVVQGLGLADNVKTLTITVESGGPIITRTDERDSASEWLALDPDTRTVVIDITDANQRTRLFDSNNEVTATVALNEVGVFHGSSAGLTDDISYTTTLSLPLKYMVAEDGVQIVPTLGSTVDWSNGYVNSKLTIVLAKGSVDIDVPMSTGETVYIESNGLASVMVYSSHVGSSGEIVFSWGNWSHIAITVDALGGSFTVAPVTDFVTFLEFTTATGRASELQHTGGTISSMSFSSSTARLAVVDTWTYLDTTSIVYSSPSIDIEDYWTADKQRVRFYGFAFISDGTVTIGGQSFTVADSLITINNREYELNDLVIDFETGTMSIKTGKMLSAASFDDPTDRQISFTGIWYFNAEYFEGEDKTIEGFGWTPGEWGLESGAAILLWIFFCILGLAALNAVQKLGIGDIAIVLFASIIGIAMMEGFM